jgi:hypothetical protein
MEYVKAVQSRYRKAPKSDKSRILEEFCRTNGYNRKYAIRLLNGPVPRKMVITRRRPFRYTVQTLQVAQAIWKASGYLCGHRLKEAIPLFLPAARRRFSLSLETERQLLAISPRQLDARLRSHKRAVKRRFYSTTRPGSLLKRMIPIRTCKADIRKPGVLEIDLVAHCGSSLAGLFLNTLTATDIHTGWTERRAVLGKGQTAVVEALREIRTHLPFPLRAIDSDNGEEFINYHLFEFCRRSNIGFTRGRPYKKDDNAHVEQKNFTHVRRIFGWDRYETDEALKAINDLYTNELRVFQNLFQPSTKLLRRTRRGTRLLRHHDRPKTPFQRVLDSNTGNPRRLQDLAALGASLDPFELSERIDQKLDRIFQLASEGPTRRPPAPLPSPPYPTPQAQRFCASPKTKRHHIARLHAQAFAFDSKLTKKEVSSVTS